MKSAYRSTRLVILSAAVLSLWATARAQTGKPESAAEIFTNARANHIEVPGRRTSIIYIQCHGLGYGDLSCYGQTNFQTPNLDKLATEGIRFTSFRPGGTNFATALGALMTGKKAGAANSPTVAGQLQAAGYRTGLIGEWPLDNKPWKRGFDEFVGFLSDAEGRNYYPGTLRRFAPHGWLTESNTIVDYDDVDQIPENAGGQHGVYIPGLFVEAMCNFVRIHTPDPANHYKPYFLMVDLPAPRSAVAGADEFPVPSDAPFADEPWPQAAKNRAALITRIDGGIGKLFEEFRTDGISNNVAIFFSSGEAPEPFKNAALNFLKPNAEATPGSGGAAAPLPMIAWCLDQIPAGQVSHFKWSGADFLPTALELSHVKPMKGVDGISVLPILEKKGGPQVDGDDGDRAF